MSAGSSTASSATRTVRLVAKPATIDLGGGTSWRTWTFNGEFPGPTIRAAAGERIRVEVENQLDEPTSVHWHGLPVPNAMDGVSGLTQPPIEPGQSFTYEFDAAPAGTYLYHAHHGLQLDRGLVGPLIIDEPGGALDVTDYSLMLDDWLASDPDTVFESLTRTGGGSMMGGGDAIPYSGMVANGVLGDRAQQPLRLAYGERLRLRLINGAAATTFAVGITGHRMTVTHADGQAVDRVEVDSLILGMGERYDVEIRANRPGPWALLAGSVDERAPGIVIPLAVDGANPVLPLFPSWPSELARGRVLATDDLRASAASEPPGAPTRIFDLSLTRVPGPGYVWTLGGVPFAHADPLPVRAGERVRLRLVNQTMMRHPIHLHGHFFRVLNRWGAQGPLRDTALVEGMMGRLTVEFVADNPGRWLLHCHHAYHMEGGMARVVEYVSP